MSAYNLFSAFFLSFFFFSAPFIELAIDLSLRGRFFPAVAPLLTASLLLLLLLALLEPSEGQLSADIVLELVDNEEEEIPADEEANDLGGFA